MQRNVNIDTNISDRLVFRLGEAAQLVGVSTRTLQRLIAAEKTPKTYRIGRAVVFRADEFRDWARSGFPDRVTFEAMQRAEDNR